MQKYSRRKNPLPPRREPATPLPRRRAGGSFPKTPRGGRETPYSARRKNAGNPRFCRIFPHTPAGWRDIFADKSSNRPASFSLPAALRRISASFRPLAAFPPKAACGTHRRRKRPPYPAFSPFPARAKKNPRNPADYQKLHGGRDWIRTSERQSRTDLQSAPFSPLDTLPSCKLRIEHTPRDFPHKLFFQNFYTLPRRERLRNAGSARTRAPKTVFQRGA